MTLAESIRAKTLAYRAPAKHWPELAGARRVLDFGGGFGIHYLEALATCPDVRWAVVETANIVNMAPQWPRLNVVSTIDDALAWLGSPPDLIHSNGALQYTNDPASYLGHLASINAPRMLFYRTLLSPFDTFSIRDIQTSRFIHHGPGKSPLLSRLFNWRKVYQSRDMMPASAFHRILSAYTITSPSPDTYICERK